ncbi:MAG: DUF2007 domain-containing protein [Nitrospiraceae bacterium]|nr:MAG: DUF2007 domain-containing protein [Nitrospiraceae bacterium]UCH45768.1 MAG: DUF2007 domain-containing protein [Nitrospiraceae bacterium]
MDDWTEIFFTYDDVEAGIVKGMLESEDIQVVIQSSKITPYPVNIGKMGEVRLLVRSADVKRAEEVMKAMQDNTKGMDDDN